MKSYWIPVLTSVLGLGHKVEHQGARYDIEYRIRERRNGPLHEVLLGNERVARVQVDWRVDDPRMRAVIVRDKGANLEHSGVETVSDKAFGSLCYATKHLSGDSFVLPEWTPSSLSQLTRTGEESPPRALDCPSVDAAKMVCKSEIPWSNAGITTPYHTSLNEAKRWLPVKHRTQKMDRSTPLEDVLDTTPSHQETPSPPLLLAAPARSLPGRLTCVLFLLHCHWETRLPPPRAFPLAAPAA